MPNEHPVAGPPAGYVAAPPRLAEAAEAAALVAAYELAHEGVANTSTETLEGDWAGADLEANAVLVRGPGGEAVALLDTVPSRAELLLTYAFVAPDARDAEELSAYLAGAAEARALRLSGGGPVTVRNYLPIADVRLAASLAARGYANVRTIYRMETELAAPPPPPEWPDGVSVRDYAGSPDEPAAYEAFELGSVGMWNRPGNTFEQWSASVGRLRGEMRLALADGEIVGMSITRAPRTSAAGLVQSLRVVPAWRRRGLGAALLADAFGACHALGKRRVGLTVDADSTTGAPELYLRAGMRVTQRYLVFEKELGGSA
ncbi:MAG: GNAT family N-acetyltransferase [Trueperaceae bacterium]|nr:GNAT family N-acetyltransferase [Trueperaceae bacterium]